VVGRVVGTRKRRAQLVSLRGGAKFEVTPLVTASVYRPKWGRGGAGSAHSKSATDPGSVALRPGNEIGLFCGYRAHTEAVIWQRQRVITGFV